MHKNISKARFYNEDGVDKVDFTLSLINNQNQESESFDFSLTLQEYNKKNKVSDLVKTKPSLVKFIEDENNSFEEKLQFELSLKAEREKMEQEERERIEEELQKRLAEENKEDDEDSEEE